MNIKIRFPAIQLVVLASAQTGAAAEQVCALKDAIYRDQNSGALITFHPLGRNNPATTSNRFGLSFLDDPMILEGQVIWNQGYSRPNGVLQLPDCNPADYDVDGACTIWQNVVYALTKKGIGELPEQDALAPRQILLPDLGRAIYYGQWDFELWSPNIVVGDVFDFDGCKG